MSLYAPCHNTRGTGTALLYPPGTSVSSVRPCHNTRNLWNTFIPGPETSRSSVELPYPYPGSTNPTEHYLENDNNNPRTGRVRACLHSSRCTREREAGTSGHGHVDTAAIVFDYDGARQDGAGNVWYRITRRHLIQ